MEAKFLEVPLVAWGVLCCVLTIVWLVFWPTDKATSSLGFRFVILRWFHALVWFLLAIAAFVAAFNIVGGPATARVLAFLSFITYVIFITTILTTH